MEVTNPFLCMGPYSVVEDVLSVLKVLGQPQNQIKSTLFPGENISIHALNLPEEY